MMNFEKARKLWRNADLATLNASNGTGALYHVEPPAPSAHEHNFRWNAAGVQCACGAFVRFD